jgi:hypothetical protein
MVVRLLEEPWRRGFGDDGEWLLVLRGREAHSFTTH